MICGKACGNTVNGHRKFQDHESFSILHTFCSNTLNMEKSNFINGYESESR